MSKGYVTPTTEATTSLLEMLFGEGVVTTEGNELDVAQGHVATFLSDEDELVAVCSCDLPFVVYSAAAIAMIPADVAEEIIASGDVPQNISDNFYEVMNICSKLMMSDRSAHLRLAETLTPEAAAEPLSKLNGSGEKHAFTLEIPAYGSGAVTFVIT